jgi:hypothetical protein
VSSAAKAGSILISGVRANARCGEEARTLQKPEFYEDLEKSTAQELARLETQQKAVS